jgi:hypothetical protein
MGLNVLGSVCFVLVGSLVACASGSHDGSTGDDQNVTASHDVFTCDLSSGDLTTGNSFKLTLGNGSVTVESSDLGKHTGKLQKNAPSVPSTSERYLISGLADDGVTGLVIPKNIKTDSRAMVHIESTSDDNKHSTNDFLCHPVDASTGAPPSGRGSGGGSGVQGTVTASCKIAANQDGSFPDTLDLVLKDENLNVKGGDIDVNGPFDKAFKPKTNTSFVRYLVDDFEAEEASTDALVEKLILSSKPGKLKLEAKNEVFASVLYNCTPKP